MNLNTHAAALLACAIVIGPRLLVEDFAKQLVR